MQAVKRQLTAGLFGAIILMKLFQSVLTVFELVLCVIQDLIYQRPITCITYFLRFLSLCLTLQQVLT